MSNNKKIRNSLQEKETERNPCSWNKTKTSKVMLVQQIIKKGNLYLNRTFGTLTQQAVEKHIPTHTRGDKIEYVLKLSKERSEPGSLGKLFKFHPDSI